MRHEKIRRYCKYYKYKVLDVMKAFIIYMLPNNNNILLMLILRSSLFLRYYNDKVFSGGAGGKGEACLLLVAGYMRISICNLRDFSHVLQFLSTCFTKSTPCIIAKFPGPERSHRWPHNSGVNKRMHFYKPKLALN